MVLEDKVAYDKCLLRKALCGQGASILMGETGPL